MTTVDETDCQGKSQNGASASGSTGAAGNKCHVDCSKRGLCDYSAGVCECFAGFGGPNCATINDFNGG